VPGTGAWFHSVLLLCPISQAIAVYGQREVRHCADEDHVLVLHIYPDPAADIIWYFLSTGGFHLMSAGCAVAGGMINYLFIVPKVILYCEQILYKTRLVLYLY
jgi:hypothetical protein